MAALFGLTGLISLTGLAGCSSDQEEPKTGVDAELVYDSTLNLETFDLSLLGADGEVLAMEQRPVPVVVAPEGQRSAHVVWSLADSMAGSALLWVQGLDNNGLAVAEGQAEVTVVAASMVEVRVELGPPARCGDGIIFGVEQCDDGNLRATDGCDARCGVEPGYTCLGTPSRCFACGNGMLEMGEQCDDGGQEPGDGCSAACQLEDLPRPTVHEFEALGQQVIDAGEVVTVASLYVPSALGRTLVMATGLLAATSEADVNALAQVTLFADDVTLDRAEHQNSVTNADGAGFVVMSVLEAGAQSATVSLSATGVGGARVAYIRLVAWQLPQGTPMAYTQGDDVLQSGVDLSVAFLQWDVVTPGDWLVIAKTNASELPSTDTVRTRLVSSFAPDTGFYANGRGPEVPATFMSVHSLAAGKQQVSLLGTSSGGYDTFGWFDNAYLRRQKVQVSDAAVWRGGRSVPLVFDHQALVNAGTSRPDGSDLWFRMRVVDGMGGEQWEDLPIWSESGWNHDNVSVWMRPQTPPGTRVTDVYMYYGTNDRNLMGPRTGPDQVFEFYDGFDNGEANPQLWQQPPPGVAGVTGQLVLQAGTQINMFSAQNFSGEILVDTKASVTDLTEYSGRFLIWANAIEIDTSIFAFGGAAGSLFARVAAVSTPLDPSFAMGPHTFGIATGAPVNGVISGRFLVDGQEVHNGEPVSLLDQRVIGVEHRGGQVALDYIRAYRPVGANVSIFLGEVEGLGGLAPSTWSFPQIVAIPLSVARDSRYVWSPEQASTQGGSLDMANMTVEASLSGKRLVLGGTRVAGDSSGTDRKSGYISVDGEFLLLTEHVLDRNSGFVSGYHHPAFVLDVRSATTTVDLAVGIDSPDGLNVEGAEALLLTVDVP